MYIYVTRMCIYIYIYIYIYTYTGFLVGARPCIDEGDPFIIHEGTPCITEEVLALRTRSLHCK